MTSTPSDKPEMIRFRCVNNPASGPCRDRHLTDKCSRFDHGASQVFMLGGVDRCQAVGEYADGAAPSLDRALCAAASMPLASPEITVNPVLARAEARRSAVRVP